MAIRFLPARHRIFIIALLFCADSIYAADEIIPGNNAASSTDTVRTIDSLSELNLQDNQRITSITLGDSEFQRSDRWFIGLGISSVTSDPNRLVEGPVPSSTTRLGYSGFVGRDFGARYTVDFEGHFVALTNSSGHLSYRIISAVANVRVNLVRKHGIIPYVKAGFGLVATTFDLTEQFGAADTTVATGETVSLNINFGAGVMYDPQQVKFLQNGDIRIRAEFALRRDTNNKSTPVDFFSDRYLSLILEYMLGAKSPAGGQIVIENDVTVDGFGIDGDRRSKRQPILYPSAAELAPLYDVDKADTIYFDSYSSYLNDVQQQKLAVIVQSITTSGADPRITITGYSDSNDFIYDKIERLRFNRAISAKRAVAIQKYLMRKGVNPDTMILQWDGDKHRKNASKTRVERALNRRAVVLVQ